MRHIAVLSLGEAKVDMLSIIVVGAIAVALVAAAWFRSFGLGLLCRSVTTESPLPLGRLMSAQRLQPSSAIRREYDLVMASVRCVGCSAARECTVLLERGLVADAQQVCPNTPFLATLKSA